MIDPKFLLNLSPGSRFVIPAATKWRIQVDRPTVLVPSYFALNDTTFPVDFDPALFYQREQARADSFATAIATFDNYVSCNGGVCLLPEPGVWYLTNPNTSVFPMIQLDAPNEAFLNYWSQALGVNNWVTSPDVAIVGAAAAVAVAFPNWYRTALIVANTAAAGTIRVGVGNGTAAAATGVPLAPGEKLALSEGASCRQRITVFAPANATVSVSAGFLV